MLFIHVFIVHGHNACPLLLALVMLCPHIHTTPRMCEKHSPVLLRLRCTVLFKNYHRYTVYVFTRFRVVDVSDAFCSIADVIPSFRVTTRIIAFTNSSAVDVAISLPLPSLDNV